jgi:hypothetical protein
MAEAPEERDHRVDVGRVVAPLQEPVLDDVVVGLGLGELDAGVAHAARHGDGALERLEVGVSPVERVAGEVEDRVLLRAAPQPLGAHERPSRGQQLDAVDRRGEQADHDRYEQPDNDDEPLATRHDGQSWQGPGRFH